MDVVYYDLLITKSVGVEFVTISEQFIHPEYRAPMGHMAET